MKNLSENILKQHDLHYIYGSS